MGLLSGDIMDGSSGAVSILGGCPRVVHVTTLAGEAGRGSSGCVFGVVVGCGVIMAYQTFSVICDRSSSLMLDNFSRGASGWGFCMSMENYLEIMMY